jgi:6,7-dimethyl-8-ribityllumazine synthase
MASKEKNLSDYKKSSKEDYSDFSFAVLVSEYHEDITSVLKKGAIDTLISHGVNSGNIITDDVPGAYELPAAAALILEKYDVDAVICLGCVIKGDTDHDIYINQAVATELNRLSTEMLTPVIFGLLTTNNKEQALDRSGGKHGNKGVECAVAALKMAALYDRHLLDKEDFGTLN